MKKGIFATKRFVSLILCLSIITLSTIPVYAFTRNCFRDNILSENELKSAVRNIVNLKGVSAGIDYLATSENCEWFNLKHWTAASHCWKHATETVSCLFDCTGFGSGDTYDTVTPNSSWEKVSAASKSGTNATATQFMSDMFKYAVPGDVIVMSNNSKKHTVVVWKNDGSTFTIYQSGHSGGTPNTPKPSDLTGKEYTNAQWVDSCSFTSSSSGPGTFAETINGSSDCGYTLLHFKNYPDNTFSGNAYTYYPSYGKIDMYAYRDSYVKSMPCSKTTDPNSVDVEKATNKSYIATGIYKNTAGNYWYEVYSTETYKFLGYVYSGDVAKHDYFPPASDVSVSSATLPTSVVKGNTFRIEGTVTAQYTKLTSVSAYIKQGSTNKCSKTVSLSNVSSYSLYPDINTAMTFKSLDVGNYTYVVEASVANYSAVDNKLSQSTEARITKTTLIEQPFSVVASSGGTTTNIATFSEVSALNITGTTADIAFRCTFPDLIKYYDFPYAGVDIYDASGNFIMEGYKEDESGLSGNYNYCYNTKKPWTISGLTHLKSYKYKLWALVDGTKYYSDFYSFTTTGSHSYTQKNTASQYKKSDATCTSAAVYYYSCTCGAVGTSTFTSGSALGHTYTNSCDTSCDRCGATRSITHSYSSTWSSDSSQHWHVCTVCGTKKDAAAHVYDNACDTTCNVCGATRSITHSYSSTWSSDSSQHWHVCTVCGTKKDVAAHVYDNACDTTCNICGATRSVTHSYSSTWSSDSSQHWHECECGEKSDIALHSGDTATCVSKAKCSVCGTEYGAYGTHSLTKHARVEATTKSAGNIEYYTCQNCPKIFADKDGKTEITAEDTVIPKIEAAVILDSGYMTETMQWQLYSDGSLYIYGTGAMPDYEFGTLWESYSESIETVTISDGVTSIGDYAFYRCTNLASVNIPSGVTSIGKGAFSGCANLASVNIPSDSKLTSIGDGAFYYCANLASVDIPSSVTSIGGYAFDCCTNLASVNIPSDSNLTSIGEGAFYECANLASVNIPSSVTSIGRYAFRDCTNLKLTISEDNPNYKIIDSCVYSKDGKTLCFVFGSPDTVTIPDGVEIIGDYAFRKCASLASVDIPSSVTSIGDSAFSGCSALKTVYYGETAEQWGDITIGSNNKPLLDAEIVFAEPVHSHSYSDTWSSDSSQHWHECECGEKSDIALHSGGTATCVSKAKCSVCGTEYGAYGTHSLTKHARVEATTESAGNIEYYTCQNCPKIFADANAKTEITAEDTVIPKLPDENALHVIVESKKSNAGKEFTVTVNIENNPGFGYLELRPEYSSELTLVKVENGTLISDLTKALQYIWVANEDTTDSGTLMTFTFTTEDDTSAGEYEVTFDVIFCANFSEEEINVEVTPGVIEILDFVWGDATGDGKINGLDVIRLKNYLANYNYETGTSTYELSAGADATGDGKINGLDVIRIKNYLANYNYETGTSSVILGPAA